MAELIDAKKIGSSGVSYQVVGSQLQALYVQLDEGDQIISPAGTMCWMTEDVRMSEYSNRARQKFVSYTGAVGTNVVCLAPQVAGNLSNITQKEGSLMVRVGQLLSYESKVELAKEFTVGSTGGGWLGRGPNLNYYELTGEGEVYLSGLGEIATYELDGSRSMIIDEANLIAYKGSELRVELIHVSGTLKDFSFAGEGLEIIKVQGRGQIWLQTVKTSELK